MNSPFPSNKLSWFSKPFPLLTGIELKLAISFGLGIVSFLILTIFRPFGLHIVESVTFLAGFGLAATIALLLHLFLGPALYPSFFNAEKWTISHQLKLIVSIIVLISIFNYFYNGTIGKVISPQYGFLEFLFMTSMVGVLPILIMIYVAESIARHRNTKLASTIKITEQVSPSEKQITIISDNVKEENLQINLNDFIFAVAANNYSEVHFYADGAPHTQLLRAKLKSVELQLSDCSQILRCHKSYLINKDKIVASHGNARSMNVTLDGSQMEVPISRSFDRSLL